MNPRYPVYIPSKGRYANVLTAKMLAQDGVPFRLVVEPPEAEEYISRFGRDSVLVLPFVGEGSSTPARNWIKEHATAAGHKRHWQLDDNIRNMMRSYRRTRIRCHAGTALAVVEDFTDRYSNVALSGLNYDFFVVDVSLYPPFHLNHYVYSCTLVLNEIPFKWRLFRNEDADISLQVLTAGWCTLLVNAFCTKKVRTMTMKGGNAGIYQGDGRLKMARSLERMWPGLVKTTRKYGRPQHHVRWDKFTQPLKPVEGLEIDRTPNEYGLTLVERAPVKSAHLRELVDGYHGSARA